VAVTSRTADAEGSAPSFDMIETVAIVFLRWVGTYVLLRWVGTYGRKLVTG
jgi:hypothetical protein